MSGTNSSTNGKVIGDLPGENSVHQAAKVSLDIFGLSDDAR